MRHKYIVKVHVFQPYDLPEDQVNGAPIRRARFLFEVEEDDFEEAKKVWEFLKEECALPNCSISLYHVEVNTTFKLLELQNFNSMGHKQSHMKFKED